MAAAGYVIANYASLRRHPGSNSGRETAHAKTMHKAVAFVTLYGDRTVTVSTCSDALYTSICYAACRWPLINGRAHDHDNHNNRTL